MMTDSPDMGVAELRRSLEHLLQPGFSALHGDIEELQEQIRKLEALSHPLPGDIHEVREALKRLLEKTGDFEQHVALLENNLADPQKVTELLRLGLKPALKEEVRQSPGHYGEIIAPVISPAISNQIRNARPEMIAALYPIIGQTISKAISEAMQDLRRRIDANLQRSFNLKQRVRLLRARLQGVPTADLILRESLEYSITHVFLIHRETGLLLKQISSSEEAQDPDIFSAMLTAIRDFAHDTMGSEDADLEEIQYGDAHILLRSGIYAYLAVVVKGVQPAGYAALMQNVIHEINMAYGEELRRFSGEMDHLHDFRDELLPLLNPSPENLEPGAPQEALSRGQKLALGWGMAGILLLLALLVFACIFTLRLLPVAFPSPTETTTPTAMPSATPTPTATLTPSPTITQTATATMTASPTMTATVSSSPLPTITQTSLPPRGIMSGNVWVRENPDENSRFTGVVVLINSEVEIVAAYDIWVKITWEAEAGKAEGWVRLAWVRLLQPIPEQLITPVVQARYDRGVI